MEEKFDRKKEVTQLIGILAIAGQPTKAGNVYSLEALQEIAKSDPKNYWMDDDKLIAKITII